jgi:hypothetical protein
MSAEPSRGAARIPDAPSSRVECSFDNDSRLVAGVGAIVSHAARRAGLPEKTQEDIDAAVMDASRASLVAGGANGTAASTANVVLEEFRDRVEVTIESPAAAHAEEIRKGLVGKVTDCARLEGAEGRVRITLLKSCGEAKAKPNV